MNTSTEPTEQGEFAGSHFVIVVHNLPVPYDRRVWLEATALRRAGAKVTVICPATEAFPARRELLEGVEIRRFWLPLGETPVRLAAEFAIGAIQVLVQLIRLRARGNVSVVQACNPPEIYWPHGWLMKKLGAKFIFDHHDLSPEMYRAKFGKGDDAVHKALRFLERQTYKGADWVLTTNRSYLDIVTTRTGYDPSRATIVRSGPSIARFNVVDRDPAVGEGFEATQVFLGEMGEQDGVDALVSAAEVLRRRGRNIKTLLIGDGPARKLLEAQVADMGLESIVRFTGRVSDDAELSRLLSSCDLGVVPDPNTDWSRYSTMNKVMEYMFFGLPVVAFDLVETRFSAQDAAIYATPDDVESLADAVEQVLDDPERAQKMGATGRERVLGQLAWEHSEEQLFAAYRSVLSD